MWPEVKVLTPTFVEYAAARLSIRSAEITHAGVGLRRMPVVSGRDESSPESAYVLCGVAGALSDDLPTGTVLIPDQVATTDGNVGECDRELTQVLRRAARSLGFEPARGMMLTASHMVTGGERWDWANRGFVAADMEAGLLLWAGVRVAAVRVILDAPDRAISADWESPSHAVTQPRLWSQWLWLCWNAPLCSWRAAAIVRRALENPGRGSSRVA